MLKILALDPSGTGTTGVCFADKTVTFQEFQSKDWLKHLEFIKILIKGYGPDLILYENTHYLNSKTPDSLSLFRLLGALESLPVKTENILVQQVKDLKGKLFKKTKTIPDLSFKPGQGWFYSEQKISLHQLDAFLVYWLWQKKGEKHA